MKYVRWTHGKDTWTWTFNGRQFSRALEHKGPFGTSGCLEVLTPDCVGVLLPGMPPETVAEVASLAATERWDVDPVPRRWSKLSRADLVAAAREEAVRLIAAPIVLHSVARGRYLSDIAVFDIADQIKKAVNKRIAELDGGPDA